MPGFSRRGSGRGFFSVFFRSAGRARIMFSARGGCFFWRGRHNLFSDFLRSVTASGPQSGTFTSQSQRSRLPAGSGEDQGKASGREILVRKAVFIHDLPVGSPQLSRFFGPAFSVPCHT